MPEGNNNGGARFDDARLIALGELLKLEASQVEPILEALFSDLLTPREYDSALDRDRSAGMALVAYACLHVVRMGVRLEDLSERFTARIEELEVAMRAHDTRARSAIDQGHRDVAALIAKEDGPA